MPGMNGIELLIKLKELIPQAEVIMLTGYADIETGSRAIREGAFDYLFKPVEDIDLYGFNFYVPINTDVYPDYRRQD